MYGWRYVGEFDGICPVKGGQVETVSLLACTAGQRAYCTLPSPLSGITAPTSLLPFSIAGVAVRFHSRAVW